LQKRQQHIKMKNVLSAFLLLSLSTLFAQSNDFFLMPYRSGNKWGLCDTLGKIKIKPEYDGFADMIVDRSSEQSFYFVKLNGRTIIIDHNNVQQLKEYDSVSPLQKVVFKNGKAWAYSYTYGNKSGKTVGNFIVSAENAPLKF
jgi:hypothetical protein